MQESRDGFFSTDTRIRLGDNYDVYLWGLVLCASPDEVRRLAGQVGPDAIAVQRAVQSETLRGDAEAGPL
jgi:hypothetical protein